MADEPGTATVRRLVDFIGLDVRGATGASLGRVNDLRLTPGQRVTGVIAELGVDGLVVANRHVGSMLGYDRRAKQGPRLVRWVVRTLHRHTGYLPVSAVTSIDWDGRVVHSSVERLHELEERTRP